ncbi:unnamed protein product [Diatraea saccharalis]|uniref:G-patch domain-containing protein n=1 Tax=Diatraea saccharalis TaxID=40085 RepID=A0A9N9WEQ7_9NEOP|nr:unnamed protein product [Diatraea saccharalis]
MFKNYSNFVKSCNSCIEQVPFQKPILVNGEEAKRTYLSIVKLTETERNKEHLKDNPTSSLLQEKCASHGLSDRHISDKDLFLSVQNDDIDTLKQALDNCPDMLSRLDEYGWSLLMIACQASSTNIVRELLNRGIDTSIRDKAGNSAQSLVIKNKNYVIADLLLSHKNRVEDHHYDNINNTKHLEEITEFFCEQCNFKVNTSRNAHFSSTIHNLNLSKGKKIPSHYIIPETNKGFQIMLKVGWDKKSGLGPKGIGTKYPIKTVQKKDRLGLGHRKKIDIREKNGTIKVTNKKIMIKDSSNDREMEVNFRRQFY